MFLQLIEYFHVVLHRSMLLEEHESRRMYRSHDQPPLFEAEKKTQNEYNILTPPPPPPVSTDSVGVRQEHSYDSIDDADDEQSCWI